MVEQQQKLVLSPYMDIYELVIPKDNLLRQMKELVDFSFIYMRQVCMPAPRKVSGAPPSKSPFWFASSKSLAPSS